MCHFNPHSQKITLSERATARIGNSRRLKGLGPLPVARAWIQLPKFQRKLTTLPNFFTSKLWAIIDGFIHVLYCYIQLSSSSQGPNRYFHSVFFPAGRLAGNRGQVFSLSTFTPESGILATLARFLSLRMPPTVFHGRVLFFLEILALHQKVKSEPSGGLKHYTRKRFQKKWVRKP